MSRPNRPRIRTVKPERYQDERMAGVSRDARLLYDGLTTQADDDGRGTANPALIRANVFPFDEDATAELIATWLHELEVAQLVALYDADGRALFAICSWADDQKVDRPTPSKLPAPPSTTDLDSSRPLASVRPGPGPGPGPGPERERDARASEPEFDLRSITIPGGGLLRLNGNDFHQQRFEEEAGGWARDHVPDLGSEEAISVMRALLQMQLPCRPSDVLEVDKLALSIAERRPTAKRESVAKAAAEEYWKQLRVAELCVGHGLERDENGVCTKCWRPDVGKAAA